MKAFIVSAVLGSCLLAGALPATAHPAIPDTHIQLVADNGAPSDRDSYVQRAKDQMREWDRKVEDFGAKTGEAAKRDLAKARAKADAAARKLESASARGWEHAKRGYEKASQNLSDTWHRINPADK